MKQEQKQYGLILRNKNRDIRHGEGYGVVTSLPRKRDSFSRHACAKCRYTSKRYVL